jgi:hypothetical protein
VTAATIQHLEQLLDLLPGTQTLDTVLLWDSSINEDMTVQYYQQLWVYQQAWFRPTDEPLWHFGPNIDDSQPSPHHSSSSSSSSGGRTGLPTGSTCDSSSWRSNCQSLVVVARAYDAGSPAAAALNLADLQPLTGSAAQLQRLFLDDVLAEQLPLYVERWQGLRALQLQGMGRCGPGVLAAAAQLTNLRHLGITCSATPITALPVAFTALVHLTSLDLSANVLTQEALEGVCDMTRLRCLALGSTKGFSTLPTRISKLVRLQMLGLQGAQVARLPEAMTALTALRVLSWSQEAATAPLLLEVVWRLRSLSDLFLTDDHVTALPEAIDNLTSLSDLTFEGQALTVLPRSTSTLVHMVRLDLSAPHLQVLPEGITALTQLKRLTAPSVQLQEQPPAVRAFLAGRQAQGCQLNLAPSQDE